MGHAGGVSGRTDRDVWPREDDLAPVVTRPDRVPAERGAPDSAVAVREARWRRLVILGVQGPPGHVWRRTQELNLATHSLALAAQQIFCTAPLLVAFAAVRHRGRVGEVLSRYLGLSPTASHEVDSLFIAQTSLDRTDALLGLLVALGFATSIAATQQRWYELVWELPRAGIVRSSLRQLAWVVGLCGYLIIVLYAGRVGHAVGHRVHAGRPTGPAAQLVVSFLFFLGSQYVLLGKRVALRRLIPGSVIMAATITVLVAMSGLVMSGQIVSQVADYGLIGATFILSLWLLTLSGALFLGSLVGEALSRWWVARHETS